MAARTAVDSAFSHNGQHFANVTSDGRLKIWDCETGHPKQEFIPTSHLSAACTCLVWAPPKQAEQGSIRKKKKRKANGEDASQVSSSTAAAGSDIVALGTASGSILLYSLNRAELVHQLTGGHSEKIHSLCWNKDGSSLFSASSDRKIIEWNALKGVIKSQWKMDKGPVFRLAMLQDGTTLVSAGRSIHCWNVETRSIMATFTGHTTNVSHLVPVLLPGDRGGYFLSAAESDRCISAWRHLDGVKSKTSQQSLASFSLQDDPLSFNVSRPVSEEDPVVLVAITVTGMLHVFEHHLNGRTKKPLVPKVTIHIGSDAAGAAKPLPILAAHPFGDVDGSCLVVYGSLVKPGFEKMSYRAQEGMVYIIRRDPMALDPWTKSDSAALKTRTPIMPADVKVLGPESMTPGAPGEGAGRKRRTHSESNASGQDSLPMEQRLSALNLDQSGADATAPPQADNMAHLLLQGLHSRDPKILQSVLDRGEIQVINNTVRRIPVQKVLPLILELTRMMQYRGHSNHSYAMWLRSLLEHHAGYLTSCPDLTATLTPLLSLMTARTTLFPKLSQLRGRLHLMLGELEHRSDAKSSTAATDLPATALLVYREESSDEASEEGDWPLQSGSESEDQWDELSDYGMDVNETKEDDDDDSEPEEDDENDEDDEENGEDDDDQLEAENDTSVDDDDDDDEVMENGLSD